MVQSVNEEDKVFKGRRLRYPAIQARRNVSIDIGDDDPEIIIGFGVMNGGGRARWPDVRAVRGWCVRLVILVATVQQFPKEVQVL